MRAVIPIRHTATVAALGHLTTALEHHCPDLKVSWSPRGLRVEGPEPQVAAARAAARRLYITTERVP